MPTTAPPVFVDRQARPIAVGDGVTSTATDDGNPMWALHGEVVGFGRTRLYVRWDGYAYDERVPHHAVATWTSAGDRRQVPSAHLDERAVHRLHRERTAAGLPWSFSHVVVIP